MTINLSGTGIPATVGHVGGRVFLVLYVIALVVVIVGLDVFIFRRHFWARLVVNIGVVMVFAGFYLRFHSALGVK